MHELPPTSEIFTLRQIAERHPRLLPENRLRWAVRNRERNGLAAANAVYESPFGVLLLHEPALMVWILGLSGRSKPRAFRIHVTRR